MFRRWHLTPRDQPVVEACRICGCLVGDVDQHAWWHGYVRVPVREDETPPTYNRRSGRLR
jgi:hypothetical protein